MTKVLLYMYSSLLFLSWLISGALSQESPKPAKASARLPARSQESPTLAEASSPTLAGATSGPLPGCRFARVRTNRWVLPTTYRTPYDIENLKKGVCATVRTKAPYVFGVDEPQYIQDLHVNCEGDGKVMTTYCVTSSFRIVRCTHLACEQSTGLYNTCEIDVSQEYCTDRVREVPTDDALLLIDEYWDEVMDGVEFWLNTEGQASAITSTGILSQLRDSKSIVIVAIDQKVGTRTSVTPVTYRTIVVDAIKAAVPDTVMWLKVGNGISLRFLVWDIMNWDLFWVQA